MKRIKKNRMKIEIYTRSMNFDLYELSAKTIKLTYQKKRCRFTSADGYLYDSILKSKADVIINIDEDAFVTDNQRLMQLIEYVLDYQYINCGVPDGGVIPIRKHNPLVTNPFFNILNVSEIRKNFDLRKVKEEYSQHQEAFEKFAPLALMKSEYKYDFYEPYCSFFVWLAVNFKHLYLDAEVHSDQISTVVKDHEGIPFLLHSWYSRMYGEDPYHTQRIQALYQEATGNTVPENSLKSELIKFSDRMGMKLYYPLKYRWERKKGY